MDYQRVSVCRCCGSKDLGLVLDLGKLPLANSYTKEPEELPVFPLELMVCRNCFHNQLSVVVDPDLMFRHYLYVSGTSRTLRAHFAGMAREALEWVSPRPRRVLDIACNDGTLLEAFRNRGCAVRGIDPARNLVAMAAGKGLEVVEGYWPEARAQVGGAFDLITAANVLGHVADPAAFLQAALDCLTPQGAVIVEFPYCSEMLLRGEWDTIYHEHLSYFLASPLLALVERLGASVTHVRCVPIHGGSLRLAVERGPGRHCLGILSLAKGERDAGVLDPLTHAVFARQVETTCTELGELVRDLAQAGRRVIGYGASAKGNTLLNRCPLPLAYIVDDNPLKHGYLTPGQQVPIRAPEEVLREGPGLHVLLLAWNFAAEIVSNLRTWRPGRGDRVIHFIPCVRCHAVEDRAATG